MPLTFAAFLSRWAAATGSERSNAQPFLADLCELLELPRPDPAQKETEENAYVFERRVTLAASDGSTAPGFIDLYKRGCFVCEAKQSGRELESSGWDLAMRRAQAQAERYARALPAAEGRPPFLVVTDVGRHLELYADFTRSGATYTPFPDARSHRILLKDLEREEIRARLVALWTDPMSLDPSRVSAKVTREIAARLATLAKSLEEAGHGAAPTASFLMRCLFSMFAEDVGLLPRDAFTGLLRDLRAAPDKLPPMLEQLWRTMDQGGLWARSADFLLRFNGGLFKDCQAPRLDKAQIDLLLEAAQADWRLVEPSIFGTLLERALDPRERHKLGAHYTPRAYVERLVLPTLVEPLRADWRDALTAAVALDQQGKRREAIAELRAFQQRLCQVRVLDPACGSGNFLYVALEHLKRLEGEVLQALAELGDTGNLELEQVTVDPHQFLGLELNPRAAAIAEMVLWIGYLQWHYRTHGHVQPPEPVLRDFHNIQCRDALLSWERVDFVTDADGKPVTRWDGVTQRPHPVTGQLVPDETAQLPVERYVNPQQASWPAADFVVGNPPFIGTKRMRQFLGNGYVDALRTTWNEVPESADFVMYWWHHAAKLLHEDKIVRFGFITTNSITQSFNNKVLSNSMSSKSISLAFSIDDHPWVDNSDGAAVRIAMTVCRFGDHEGIALSIDNSITDILSFTETHGIINHNLSIGTDVSICKILESNSGISGMGVALHGSGFIIDSAKARLLCNETPTIIRKYIGGKDLLQNPRERYLIDFFGMNIEDARQTSPSAFQHLIDYVKPERDQNNRKSLRELWWRFGWERPLLRNSIQGLNRFIGTTETAKHRIFQFLSGDVLADHMIICFALNDARYLGLLSSRIHTLWAFELGGTLVAAPRYNKTRCFENFPFPDADVSQQARLRALGETLDAHRKARQAAHAGLTLTGMYNVLEALRQGRALSDKERGIHAQGLVAVLGSLHDDIDREVLGCYGWQDLAPALVGRPGGTLPLADPAPEQAAAQEELLTRLVALNAERAAEEKQGLVRWLRPDFQCRGKSAAPVEQAELEMEAPIPAFPRDRGGRSRAAGDGGVAGKLPWPKELKDQVRAVREALAAGAHTPDEIAARFKRSPLKGVAAVLEALEAMG